jgi:acyl carrier protein
LSTAAEQEVAAIYASVLNVPGTRISPGDDLFSLGGDSLQAIRIALELERKFGVEVTPESLAASSRVGDVAARLSRR